MNRRFPWKIFTRVVVYQAVLVFAALAAAGIAVRVFIQSHFTKLIEQGEFPRQQLAEVLKVFDTSVLIVLGWIVIVLTVVSIWAGRKLVFPIGRILMKTRKVLSSENAETRIASQRLFGTSREPQGVQSSARLMAGITEESELSEETFDELSDLESSIEDIRRDLEAKSESLRIEREELSTLMTAISDGILAVDSEETVLFFNSRFMLLFGGEEIKNRRRLWELFRDPEILAAFRHALKKGRSSTLHAIPFEHEGGKRFFSISVAPLRKGPGEEIYGAVGVFHDVTDLKRAEQIRIDFVANVSHELRTPLTSIKGYADTIAQDVRESRPVAKEFVDVIVRNTERLMNLINDLLDISALESTEVLQETTVQTGEITQRVLKQLEGRISAKGHRTSVSTQVPTVVADPGRVEQVLVNLLDNAIKYTPAGGDISVAWEYGKDHEVLLKVSDTGPGIPPEHHARLFERFYRVDKARSREMGGTGLGLAIVKHIMQRHHGSVSVESVVGRGTTFVCHFSGASKV